MGGLSHGDRDIPGLKGFDFLLYCESLLLVYYRSKKRSTRLRLPPGPLESRSNKPARIEGMFGLVGFKP